MSPRHASYAKFQEAPQQLSPAGMNHRLQAMRVFFSMVQRRGYTVDGTYTPKLHLTWVPDEAFRHQMTSEQLISPIQETLQRTPGSSSSGRLVLSRKNTWREPAFLTIL